MVNYRAGQSYSQTGIAPATPDGLVGIIPRPTIRSCCAAALYLDALIDTSSRASPWRAGYPAAIASTSPSTNERMEQRSVQGMAT